MGYLEKFTLEDTISAYEKTMEVTGDNGEHCYSPVDEITLIFLKELKAYRDAEEQGLLLRLPCKVGDDIYSIPSEINYRLNVLSKHEENNRVYHQKVAHISFTKNGWYVECDKDVEYGTDRICIEQHLGITWFLDPTKAEQKLAEMKGE